MEEILVINEKPQVKKLTALKVISIIFFVATFVLLLIGLIDSLGNEGNSLTLGMALYFIFFVLVFGLIGNVLALIPAVIGLIYTAKKSKQADVKNQLIFYIVITALPIISELAFIIICQIIL